MKLSEVFRNLEINPKKRYYMIDDTGITYTIYTNVEDSSDEDEIFYKMCAVGPGGVGLDGVVSQFDGNVAISDDWYEEISFISFGEAMREWASGKTVVWEDGIRSYIDGGDMRIYYPLKVLLDERGNPIQKYQTDMGLWYVRS